MYPMGHPTSTSRFGGSRLRVALSGLVVLVAAAALAAPAAADSPAAAGMSIVFPSKTASVSGPGAVVLVKCAGSSARECAGTLTVEGLSENHSVSYAVARGEQRSLVVPLGGDRGFFSGIAAPKMRVVAETVQPTGGTARSVRVLRFK